MFFTIYGGKKFEENALSNSKCTNVSDSEFNALNNCTVIQIKDFESFGKTAYTLFRLIFGSDLPSEDDMNKIDSLITSPLIAVYIGLMTLIFINVFIALLSAKFSIVYDKAEYFLTLERATEILKTENLMIISRFCMTKTICLRKNKNHNDFCRSTYNPYEEKNKNKTISLDDRMSDIENHMSEQSRLLVNIAYTFIIFY